MPPCEVEAVEQTISYMDELESKENHMSAVAVVTPVLRGRKVQPLTPAPQLGVVPTFLGLKREYALRRLLLKRRGRKIKSLTIITSVH